MVRRSHPGRVQNGNFFPTSRAAGRGRSRRRAIGPSLRLPRDAPPFGVFPSPVAAPRHRGRCLLVVLPVGVPLRAASPLGSVHTPTVADLEALLHRRVRCAAPRCRTAPPDTPMGLRQSQGSTHSSRQRPWSRQAPRRSGIDHRLDGTSACRQRATRVRSSRSPVCRREHRSASDRLTPPAVPSRSASPCHATPVAASK
jgi:hypothetical protein